MFYNDCLSFQFKIQLPIRPDYWDYNTGSRIGTYLDTVGSARCKYIIKVEMSKEVRLLYVMMVI